MTTSEMSRGRGRTTVNPVRSGRRVRRVLLLCGALSSLLYAATDLVGGLSYPGYSFTSQAISELMAIGAPSEAVVDPLFILYGVLALAFGVGVLREGSSRSRALRITGTLLIGYALFCFTGPTLFEMHPRGTEGVSGDASHIIVTGALVLLLLLAMGFGAFALGKRFRAYSLGALSTVIVFGALTAPYVARLGAGQSTPGFGIIERIHVYTFMMWTAVLAVALMRRPMHGGRSVARSLKPARIDGLVAPEFEEVRAEFERNPVGPLLPRRDRGAAGSGVLHRSAAGDSERTSGRTPDVVQDACAPGVAQHARMLMKKILLPNSMLRRSMLLEDLDMNERGVARS